MELLNLAVIWEYGPALLRGLAMTVALTCTVIVLAGILAIPVALMRLSRNRGLRLIADIYVEIIRGTPLLLQLFYIYFVLPSVGITLNPILAGIVGLTINYTAYMSEVYRAGFNAVPKGQSLAAAALGMVPRQAFLRIVLPQALRIITPALGNFFISLFKDTALTAVITVPELLYTGQNISARSYQYFTIYTAIGGLYLASGIPAAMLVRYLERRFPPTYARRKTGKAPTPMLHRPTASGGVA
ncbi:MAG TPA: amino acid ABC transporter permease [Nordella sp.]|nr:amino acid ABC transporter permease [Nordella sp.]